MEPVAIVGMSCRFPGAASLREFWKMLADGRHGITETPADRWSNESLYDIDPKAPGRLNTRYGGFIRDIDRFDAAFFGVSPREAVQMDPQQRLLAEVSYEALEDAGIPPGSLAGGDTAVYVGLMSNDYLQHQLADTFTRIDVHTGAGAGYSMTANRLSYLFDFRGPSVAVDCACSSSLVAAFLACQAIWTGQSRVALAAGVNLMLSPAFNVFYAKGGLSAPDGKCKTFSAAADGIGRGEGAGVVVLKSLAHARADGDRIYAVIRGGAVNHDGRSNGLTAPNRWAQEQLLRTAFKHARVKASELQYIELHGTGTYIGDPIEANALGAVLREDDTPRAQPCLVGSVKTNVGHLEGAAGIAGLMKLALSLSQRRLPPSLWFDAPNPHIPFDRLPLKVNTELTPWPAHNGRCLAGVSSFGLGGTNAHLVLESAPLLSEPDSPETDDVPLWLLISARSEAALRDAVGRYADFIAGADAAELPAICQSAVTRKGIHEYRLSLLADDKAGLLEGLRAYLQRSPTVGVWYGRLRPGPRKRVLVVMPHASCIEVDSLIDWLKHAPAAARAWQSCRAALAEVGAPVALPAIDTLERFGSVTPGEPIFACLHVAAQYAQLMQLLNLLPTIDGVCADGLGQVAAYCAAGALPLGAAFEVLTRPRYGDVPVTTGAFRFPCHTSGGTGVAFAALGWDVDGAALAERANGLREQGNADGVWLGLTGAAVGETSWIRGDETGRHPYCRVVARLATHHTLAWARLYDRRRRLVTLPAYPWQGESYWLSKPDVGPPVVARETSTTHEVSSGHTRASILARPTAERRETLVRYLSERVAAALRMPADAFDPERALNTMGIDSLTAVEVKNRIERDFQITVPVVKFLDGYAVSDFADFMLNEMTLLPTVIPAEPASSVSAPSPDIDASVLDQVHAMSARQLDDMLRQLMPEGVT